MTLENQNDIRDLIVIGGGSAGMAAAIRGAAMGLKVTLFDAAGEEYDKPCGEGLMPPALAALGVLGVTNFDSYPFRGVSYVHHDGEAIFATFSGGQSGMGVRRRVLRKALWTRARELEVVIIQQRVVDLAEVEDLVIVEGIKGRFLCLATGNRDTLLKNLDLHDERHKKLRPSRTGLRRHAKMKPWSDMVEVYWSEDAELYVTPVAEGLVNIAILAWKPFTFDEALKWFPAVSSRLKDADWDDAASGVSPLAHRGRELLRGRTFLAGDAAGFLDAMTGEGNALALQSGIAVAEVIAGQTTAEYPARWQRITWRYWVMTRLGLWFSAPGARRRFSLWALFRMPLLLQMSLRFLSTTRHQNAQVNRAR